MGNSCISKSRKGMNFSSKWKIKDKSLSKGSWRWRNKLQRSSLANTNRSWNKSSQLWVKCESTRTRKWRRRSPCRYLSARFCRTTTPCLRVWRVSKRPTFPKSKRIRNLEKLSSKFYSTLLKLATTSSEKESSKSSKNNTRSCLLPTRLNLTCARISTMYFRSWEVTYECFAE